MKAVVLGAFVGETNEELTLPAGVTVEVLRQTADGWWDIKYGDKVGIFPYTYLSVQEEGDENEENGESEEEEQTNNNDDDAEEQNSEEQQTEQIEESYTGEAETSESEGNDVEEQSTEIEEDSNSSSDNNNTEEQNEVVVQSPTEEVAVVTEAPKPRELPSVPRGGAGAGGAPVRGQLGPRGSPRGAPTRGGGGGAGTPVGSPRGAPRGGAVGAGPGPGPGRGSPGGPGAPQGRGGPQARPLPTPNSPTTPNTPPTNPNPQRNSNPNLAASTGGAVRPLPSPNAPRALPNPNANANPTPSSPTPFNQRASVPHQHALQQMQSQVQSNASQPQSQPLSALRRQAPLKRGSMMDLTVSSTTEETPSFPKSLKSNSNNVLSSNNNNNTSNEESNSDVQSGNNNNNNASEVKDEEVISKPPPEEPVNMSDDERAKLEQHRRNVVEEIIQTEKDYVIDLETVSKVFITPLNERGLISPMDSQSLFSNITVIISVNKEVARLFETRSDAEKDGPLLVGDIFLKMADFFKMYTTYCANQPKALATLDRLSKTPAFAEFLQEQLLNPETRSLTLFSFLIKPIQRICKYPLLLKDLLKHTLPSHPDYDNLDNALIKINEVVEYVNDRKRLAENLQKILEIQDQIDAPDSELSLVAPSRRFVREGSVSVFEKGRRQQRKMFVFNDLIVLTKGKKSMMGNTLKDHFKGKFMLNDVKLVEMADSNEIVDACEVRPKDPKEKAMILVFSSTNEKREWLKEVKTLVKEFQKKEAQAAKEAMLKKAEEDKNGTSSDSLSSLTDSPKASGRASLRNTMPNLSPVAPPPPPSTKSLGKPSPPAGHRLGGAPRTPPPPPQSAKKAGGSIFGKKSKKDEGSKKKLPNNAPQPVKVSNQFSKELAKTLEKKKI